MAIFSLGEGDEVRLVFVRHGSDGEIDVRQVSEGPDTTLCYGSRRHVETLSFRATAGYGFDDLVDDIRRRGDDFFITDLADTLDLWEIPFAHTCSGQT